MLLSNMVAISHMWLLSTSNVGEDAHPQMLVRMRSNKNSQSLLVEMHNGLTTVEDSWEFLTELNIFSHMT